MVGSLGLFKAVVPNSHAVRFCSPAWEAKAGAGWFWFCVCVCGIPLLGVDCVCYQFPEVKLFAVTSLFPPSNRDSQVMHQIARSSPKHVHRIRR